MMQLNPIQDRFEQHPRSPFLTLDFLIETHNAGFEAGMLFFFNRVVAQISFLLSATHRFCG